MERKTKFILIILLAAFVLLVINIINTKFDSIFKDSYLLIVSNVLLIIAMLYQLKIEKK